VRDKNRHISEQLYFTLRRCGADGVPALRCTMLLDHHGAQRVGMTGVKLSQRTGIAVTQRLRPVDPGRAAVFVLDDDEARKIVQPVMLPDAPVGKMLRIERRVAARYFGEQGRIHRKCRRALIRRQPHQRQPQR